MLNSLKNRFIFLNLLALLSLSLLFFPLPSKAATYYVDKGHASASDSNNGSEGSPWKTIQKAASTLVAGDTVYVKAGLYQDSTQIQPVNSGTIGQPITYTSYPGQTVIIDKNSQTNAFYLVSKSYITISGFEIKNGTGGIKTDGASNIIIENNHIHNIDAPAGSNVGGIQFNSCSYCSARNNSIHDIFVNGTNTSFQNGANGAGIQSFKMEYTTIENNEIYNVYSGVYHKQSSGNTGVTIKANIIHDATLGVFYSNAGATPHKNQKVVGNIFYNIKAGIELDLDGTVSINNGFVIANNVFVASLSAISIVNVKNVEIYNNIFVGSLTNAVFNAKYDDWYINYFDNNIYYNIDKWWTNTYSTAIQQNRYSTLSSWQGGTGYDLNSSSNDPRFVNISSRDFHISSGFEQTGRNGLFIGAYPTGSEVVGISTRSKPATNLY